ncbi:MAG: RNA methyltransferase [bacterium]|nr:RNA methyltransferase [bacterium]
MAVREVSEEELAALAGAELHNGFAASVCAPAISPPVSREETSGDPDLRVLVEDVQDPRNLGALLRVCEAAGVGRVLVRDRGSAPLSPTVARTSAGASEWLAIERITNSAQVIVELQGEGFWVYGAAAEGDPPWEVDLTGKVLFCLGGEEKGLRARTRKICDRLVGLPMCGRVESLNLATAASGLLYEAIRQRQPLQGGGERDRMTDSLKPGPSRVAGGGGPAPDGRVTEADRPGRHSSDGRATDL